MVGHKGKFTRKHFKELLKPGSRKIVLFLVLFAVVLLIPIYPADSMKYSGPTYETTNTFLGSSTKLESFLSVWMNDFEWTISDVDAPSWFVQNTRPIYYRYEYTANPSIMLMYVPLVVITYLFSCYYVEIDKDKHQKSNI
jgi:hypothetical protein